MKRNGIVNLLRLWFLERFGPAKPYKEIIPRNYFHALQMNSFVIDFMDSNSIHFNNPMIGVIVLPYDQRYNVLDDETISNIIKDWIACGFSEDVANSIQIKACIRGKYVSDTGEVFNQDSHCIIVEQCTLTELADIGMIIKDKMGTKMVLIKHQDSNAIYGISDTSISW
ncbi:MAG: hypothetical protein ACKOX1_09515 [Ignavibacteria bacterium]